MRRAETLGLAAIVMLFVACISEGTDSDTPNLGPDAGSESAGEEPRRPERPDASPEDLIPDAAPPLPCVEGDAQVSDPDTGHCYILLDNSRNWTAAQGVCTDLGMHLATIADDAENELIHGLIGGREAWLAGNDIAAEADWQWNTGEPMIYQNWRAGEPNNGGGEDCMLVEGNRGGQWDDRSCGDNKDAVCERDYP